MTVTIKVVCGICHDSMVWHGRYNSRGERAYICPPPCRGLVFVEVREATR
jgi:hypothetical protein